MLCKNFSVDFDETGSIGKRYRRQDEIGTPFCITYDFDTLEKDNCVTVRDRDTMEQVRMPIDELEAYLKEKTTLLSDHQHEFKQTCSIGQVCFWFPGNAHHFRMPLIQLYDFFIFASIFIDIFPHL